MSFLIAAAVTLVATPVVGLLARRLGIVDHPGGRRIHRTATPRLGGLAVMAGFFASFTVLYSQLAPNFRPGQLMAFTGAAVFLLLVGVIAARAVAKAGHRATSR